MRDKQDAEPLHGAALQGHAAVVEEWRGLGFCLFSKSILNIIINNPETSNEGLNFIINCTGPPIWSPFCRFWTRGLRLGRTCDKSVPGAVGCGFWSQCCSPWKRSRETSSLGSAITECRRELCCLATKICEHCFVRCFFVLLNMFFFAGGTCWTTSLHSYIMLHHNIS